MTPDCPPRTLDLGRHPRTRAHSARASWHVCHCCGHDTASCGEVARRLDVADLRRGAGFHDDQVGMGSIRSSGGLEDALVAGIDKELEVSRHTIQLDGAE